MRTWGRFIFILLAIVFLYLFLFIFFNSIGYYMVYGWPWEHAEEKGKQELYQEIMNQTRFHNHQVSISTQTLRKLDARKDWLQILDEQGNEIYQYQKPKTMPEKYTYLQLTDLKKGNFSTGYQVYTFYSTVNDRKLTWVFGYAPFDTELVKKSTVVSADKIAVSEEALREIRLANAWLQILDENGNEVYQYHRPDSYPRHYAPGEFVYYDETINLQQHIFHMTDTVNGKRLTWLFGFSEPILEKYYRDFGMSQDIAEKATYTTLRGIVSFVLSLVIVSIIFALRFTSPMLHIMQWLKQLAVGIYEEPSKNGVPRSISRFTGDLKRSYRDFIEVIQALKYLTFVLKKNDQDRRKLEKTREEWLAGVSHDLKTPLSAVKGYADLLAEPQYEWSKEEVRQYAKVIQDKANYMENLINDLNLTFRLKNDALHLQKKPFNLVELVRRAVIDIVNDPRAEAMEIEFHPAKEELIYPVDVKWFKRALNNLLINAVVHNPPGTKINVSVEQDVTKDQIFIVIEDNGVGMDQETLAHLFDRYFRGTRAKKNETGTGLGMAIAEQLIKAHDGRIDIESEIGRGTKIRLSFLLEASVAQLEEKKFP
ncbi:HAMP domain-containing sensor histidine kinase [Thermoflavimicrobium dichotomicum]|uniref:histidine kinase n=1 Tax=Thermoflavimicrobium dichotomicum TaxID=46223 RepID=A0A1I3JKA2_9BACL|nr:HAMP domain-containing sensor histidine kinase [Thermoflavimicrobium dichotomicum]SFI60305.1 Signal transduction histidine kinase [Thermoflavimicrobium dichotomicum]